MRQEKRAEPARAAKWRPPVIIETDGDSHWLRSGRRRRELTRAEFDKLVAGSRPVAVVRV